MRDESLQNNGPTFRSGMMCEHSPLTTSSSGLTWSVAETHAKRTAAQPEGVTPLTRVSAVSSSALLLSFARDLFSAKIQRSPERMLPGLGNECDVSLSRLVTLCCPSDCERVALGHSTSVTGCSCSASLPTPTASDWKGGKRKQKAGTQANLRDVFTQTTGLLYLHPEDLEAAQGFPATWTELKPLETPLCRKSPNTSATA